jgi:predicted HAD superfamily Cof-like phosphohydrolase
MNKSIELVRQFHETFEHPVGVDSSHVEPLKIRQLRIKLLFEELAELAEASDCQLTMTELCSDYATPRLLKSDTEVVDGDNVNKVEELDALCDIQYVLDGKILTSGLHQVFWKAFETVHKNNMGKAHTSEAHCKETIRHLLSRKGGNASDYTILKKSEGVYLLLDANGKLTKPHNHTKVKLKL